MKYIAAFICQVFGWFIILLALVSVPFAFVGLLLWHCNWRAAKNTWALYCEDTRQFIVMFTGKI